MKIRFSGEKSDVWPGMATIGLAGAKRGERPDEKNAKRIGVRGRLLYQLLERTGQGMGNLRIPRRFAPPFLWASNDMLPRSMV
ncbi:Hypothetical protein NTJ_03979 [Nesidiocoris tenuis]|uniref:Uncharacterized protein n=1 Tax=Nesidiocoris tenuis TaxID=355587 RepID=A0ABN7AJX0_9HEMI|nr:Hypothetical protein NTJ_03979 [Nesidiocoris tenuis]